MSAKILPQLNNELLGQPFNKEISGSEDLIEYQKIAANYSIIENSLAILSDLKENKSYIYCGSVAEKIGIANKGDIKLINSIWEEELFNKIHPDDLVKKHLLELQFFYFLKSIPASERSNYSIESKMRILDNTEKYIIINHRMFYISSSTSGNLWFALCLYNISYKNSMSEEPDGYIINSSTGGIINMDDRKYQDILSKREKEILNLVDRGKMSEEIAGILSISRNTVNRHRQNILEKLRVKNSHEACRVAKLMSLL